MRLAARTASFLIVTAILFAATHVSQSQQAPQRNLKPIGPDALFTALPDVTYEGKAPEAFSKAIVLRVPNRESWSDAPEQDLKSNDRTFATGFELTLDMHLEYRPWFHKEPNRDRLLRYEATLRFADVPRVGSIDVVGKKFAGVDKALDTFAADYAFLLSYAPGKDGAPAMGAAFRYRRGAGVEAALEWEFTKLGKPEGDSAVRSIEEKVINLIGQHGREDAEGKWREYPFAPVPRLVANDSGLREYVKMHAAFYSGESTRALVHFAELMAADPACGRAALYGIEINRAMSETQTDLAEHTRYREAAVNVGREALKHTPNDVMLRAHLCWYGAVHFSRFEFAQAGLKQAMKVQPANVEVFNRWLAAYEVEDRAKQVQWLTANAAPLVKDGRIEYAIGTIYYGSGDYAKGVEWYQKAVKLAPLEHEYQKCLGLCGTYLAESEFRKRNNAGALDAWIAATDGLARAQDIDPSEVKWVYEYYGRVATHDYSHLPTRDEDLERLFLSQAVFNGLASEPRTFQWDRLVKDMIAVMRRTLRETCRSAKPGDAMYEIKLMARLQFARVDDDTDDVIHTLWLMRGHGLRTELYYDYMRRFGPLVEEYKPKEGGK